MALKTKRLDGSRAVQCTARVSAVLTLFFVLGVCPGGPPAAARELTYFATPTTTTLYTYSTCGDTGTVGNLYGGTSPSCIGDTRTIVPTLSTTVMQLYATSALSTSREVLIRGKELRVNVDATVPGDLIFDIGYGGTSGVPPRWVFTTVGSVTVHFDGQSPPEGTRVDLSKIEGRVPRNERLAFRVRKSNSPLTGTLHLGTTNDPELRTLRVTIYDGVWTVNPDGSGDYTNIQAAIDAIDDTNALAPHNGDHFFVVPGNYTAADAGFTGVNFGTRRAVVVAEAGPGATSIDLAYGGFGFDFSANSVDQHGVEGFTIRRASLGAVRVSGGASPVIRNCIIRDSREDVGHAIGGGISISASSTRATTVEDCTFTNNVNYYGGAIGVSAATGTARLTVRRCTFVRNTAGLGGGAIAVNATGSGVRVESSLFRENTAILGGALWTGELGTVAVDRCRFEENDAQYGGAVASVSATISNSTLVGNRAIARGGAVWTVNGTSTAFTFLNHCTVLRNHAGLGGGIVLENGYAGVANSIFWSNTHELTTTFTSGSASAGPVSGREILQWATPVAGNYLRVEHVDVQDGTSAVRVTNGVKVAIMERDPGFVSPTAPQLAAGSPCIGQATTVLPLQPAGYVFSDLDLEGIPREIEACAKGGSDLGAFEFHGDCGRAVPLLSETRVLLRTRQDGPPPNTATIAVHNLSFPAVALPWSVEEDIPWLEVLPPASGETVNDVGKVTLFANPEGLAAGEYRGRVTLRPDYTGGTAPYPPDWLKNVEVILQVTRLREVPGDHAHIQDAIDAAADGDEIVVADGTYTHARDKNLWLRGRQIVLRSANGREATTIDCAGDGHGLIVPPGNLYPSVFQGFTVTQCNGLATETTSRVGGGVWTAALSSVTVLDSLFLDNHLGSITGTGTTKGGGMAIMGEATVSNCEFRGNDAELGGGIWLGAPESGDASHPYFAGGELVVENASFASNTADYGGGVYLEPSGNYGARVSFSSFTSNRSGTRTILSGGGAYLAGWNVRLTSSLFDNNGASTNGAGVYVDAGNSTVANCVFISNDSSQDGGGLYLASASYTAVTNCTVKDNTASDQGGGIYTVGAIPVTNCIITSNTAYGAGSPNGDEVWPVSAASLVSYSQIFPDGASEGTLGGSGNLYTDPLFNVTNASEPDDPVNLRLQRTSPCVDSGVTVNTLFSDFRGSYRMVDGPPPDNDSLAEVDKGAFEYSHYYGGVAEDGTTKAFQDLVINGSLIATGFEYRIEWKDKAPFPTLDERAQQAGEYDARLLLVDEHGRRVELGTWTMRLAPTYSVPYIFGYDHLGTWRIRLEMVTDPDQFLLSAPITIEYKKLQTFLLAREIAPPAGALPGLKPDIDYPPTAYWSTETKKLWAIGPYTTVLTWYADENRSIPISTVIKVEAPQDAQTTSDYPQFHVIDAPPVPVSPEGTRFSSAEILWSDSGASISSGAFTALRDGWTVLLFRDSRTIDPAQREYFTLVRSLTWDHAGGTPVAGGLLGPRPPVDPYFPIATTRDIGLKVTDDEHQPENACGGGHVFFELAPYDGTGDKRAYDRATRSGQIFLVNDDDPDNPEDDLLVVWYRRHDATGICWPFKPVRYDPTVPAATLGTCPGSTPGVCSTIDVTLGKGTGSLPPEYFGTLDNMMIYNQPDRSLPGFNPNEEHAMFFPTETSFPGAFPLRNDLNRISWNNPSQPFTSPPLVLLKYRDPDTGEWTFNAYLVDAGSLAAGAFAGNEINPPYPLNQFVFGPCRDTETQPNEHNGTWSDATPFDGSNPDTANVLKDKDDKLFFIRGDGTVVRGYYFYRMQEDFWFDFDGNGRPEHPAGECIPWLDGYPGGNFDDDPAAFTYTVDWPLSPTLTVGETLADAKTQPGETVGLPNVKDQCRVQKVLDEPGVRLFDPLKEHWVELPGPLPPAMKLDPPNGLGSTVKFRDLPPQLQSRLTWDSTTERLKLKGLYVVDTGEPVLLLNTLSERELEVVRNLPYASQALKDAALALKSEGDANLLGANSITQWEADFKAVSAGRVTRTGYVTLAFNNDERCPAPTMVNVIRVGCPLYTGALKVIESPNPFEEKLTMRHNGDFGGKPDERYFQWKYLQGFSGIPDGPTNTDELWFDFDPANSFPGPTGGAPPLQRGDDGLFYLGLVDVTPLGTGQQLLPDRWFSARYYYPGTVCTDISPWTPPMLAEGWVKRVMKKINLYDQKVKDFHKSPADTLSSMIALAGRAYEGDVALSDEPTYLNQLGLIELYETLLRRALDLSLDAVNHDATLLQAVLFATTRLNALYMLLGNEAYADSADPTVGFGTKDGQYGAMAPSMFAFQNQADTLLEEELTLLRGRAEPGIRPFYNRLPWNFTIGEGEVAYRQAYNIQDVADTTGVREPDGEINEFDAKALFPQGHGDAWGHYTSALKKWYYLVTHPWREDYWQPQTEAILVAQAPVHVDYRDERAFATAAAARARAGADIVGLTYRDRYDEDPERQWQGYRDTDGSRAWGLAEWASRAGEGAYIDWAVGNALLPSVAQPPVKYESFMGPGQARYLLGPDFFHGTLVVTIHPAVGDPIVVAPSDVRELYDADQGLYTTEVTFSSAPVVTGYILFQVTLSAAEGIARVDRTTVVDLHEIAAQFDAIQAVVDQADAGLNPLGVAKDTVPFDIDPTLVAMGQTHFEQIYSRAAQALQNAVSVFDYANQGSQLLRRQQDSLEDFKRTVADREADFNNRLVEVFGYPYADDCGPGRTYPTGYCETGPDFYHYMYVERSVLMGLGDEDESNDQQPEAVREDSFTVTFKNLDATAEGGVESSEAPVTFTIDADRRFGLLKPRAWTSSRKAAGALQLARSDLLQLRGRLERTLAEYDALVAQVGDEKLLVDDLEQLNADELRQLDWARTGSPYGDPGMEARNTEILNARKGDIEARSAAQDAVVFATALAEALPMVNGIDNDFTAPFRSLLMIGGQIAAIGFMGNADRSQISELSALQAKEAAAAATNREIVRLRGQFAVKQQTLPLQTLVRQEGILRQEIHTLVEALNQSAARYLNTLAAGERLLAERLRFRKQTAGQIQDYRYTDMTFRVFRNDALQKYKAQLDLAARYVYLAAKAYDYETTLLDASGLAGRAFLTDIVKQRSVGTVLAGQPLAGSGLADTMRRLSQNFQVLKPQLGFNNPQKETNRFSLRREMLRISYDSGSDETWRAALARYAKPDLWAVPEFRRYCRPFAAPGVPQPGLVIPFGTTVTSGLNFFGWPLGGGDSYYSAANFATKVRSVGVWLSNYNAAGLVQTPRVYLVPAGEDVLRSPTGGAGDIRTWHVLDQRLPAPELVNTQELAGDRAWIPGVDTVLDEFGAVRRHADFKAFHDSGYLDPDEMTYDTRLIGRSVWNTKWMLIIPGRNLLWDPDEGIETLIYGPEVYGGVGQRSNNGISDIKLFFETYAYSGY